MGDGAILPREVLDLPEKGCVNLHASLLPRWRGPAPIHTAIRTAVEAEGSPLQFIVSTRVDPPLPLARWRVEERILEEIRSLHKGGGFGSIIGRNMNCMVSVV